jgi:uncharacterized protein YutE (UPF0331/DUF86 family)
LPDKDILVEKITHIQRCLKRIKDATGLDSHTLDNYDSQDIFVLNLQRAVQAAIDIAVHIVNDNGWGVAKALKENFSLLEENKVISKDISDRLKKMVGFRNLAVHDYSELNVDILKNILTKSLVDLEKFYTIISEKYISQTD